MKSVVTILVLFFSVTMFAQKGFQGKAIYKSKTTFDMSRFDKSKMSEERKKRILDRMKNMLEKTFVLNFDQSASIYKEEEKLATPGGAGRGFRFGGFGGGTKYKNIKEKKALEATEFFGKKFLVSENLEQPKWELGSETKQIGKYTCYKATLIKKPNALDFGSFRRKSSKTKKVKDSTKTKNILDEVELPKEILVTAWYTPQIPVSNGPGEYWGLPGLILEINSGKTTILCSEIVINPSDKIEISAPTKGKEITRKKYNKTIKKKMEEMREMFKNRRKSSNRRSRH